MTRCQPTSRILRKNRETEKCHVNNKKREKKEKKRNERKPLATRGDRVEIKKRKKNTAKILGHVTLMKSERSPTSSKG